LVRLLNDIFATDGAEIECEQFQVLLPAYVESELNLAEQPFPAGHAAALQGHLAHCLDCQEEHQVLRTVLALAAEGALPDVEEVLSSFGVEEPETEQTGDGLVKVGHCSD